MTKTADRTVTNPVINLCFHGIGHPQRSLEPGEDRYWIGQDHYLRVLDEVSGRSDVTLSFDDGNTSDVSIGLPALLDRGLHASFFVLAGRLQQPGSLSAQDLRLLVEHGMEIGSHGMRHVPWRHLTAEDLSEELDDARRELEEAAGTTVNTAALPLGRYDRRVLAALRRRGYRRVFSSDRLPARRRAWLQSRYSAQASDSLESVRSVLGGQPWRRTLVPRFKTVIKRLR